MFPYLLCGLVCHQEISPSDVPGHGQCAIFGRMTNARLTALDYPTGPADSPLAHADDGSSRPALRWSTVIDGHELQRLLRGRLVSGKARRPGPNRHEHRRQARTSAPRMLSHLDAGPDRRCARRASRRSPACPRRGQRSSTRSNRPEHAPMSIACLSQCMSARADGFTDRDRSLSGVALNSVNARIRACRPKPTPCISRGLRAGQGRR